MRSPSGSLAKSSVRIRTCRKPGFGGAGLRVSRWAVLRDTIDQPTDLTGVVGSFAPHVIEPGDTEDPVVAGGRMQNISVASIVGIPPEVEAEISANMWAKSVAAAEAHYEPGVFTPLIGWEWTQTNNGVNLHRVVMSTLNGEQAARIDPVGSGEAPYPHQLWEGLAALQEETGARFMAIPHNSNLSKGYMFSATRLNGEPITAEFARTRMEWEPIVEVTQIKGDSETDPTLSPDDEFADFEPFNFYLQNKPQGANYQAAVGDFMRSGLRRGLEIEQRIGVNPYQFGVIGSTDAHTSIASAEEPNFWGKMAKDSIPENKRHGDATDEENEYEPGVDNNKNKQQQKQTTTKTNNNKNKQQQKQTTTKTNNNKNKQQQQQTTTTNNNNNNNNNNNMPHNNNNNKNNNNNHHNNNHHHHHHNHHNHNHNQQQQQQQQR